MSEKTYFCKVSGKPIPPARVDFLRESGIPSSEWTTVEHSREKKKKGIWLGEVGTSTLLFVDSIDTELTVRTVCREVDIVSPVTPDDDDIMPLAEELPAELPVGLLKEPEADS